jgi:hypothetical protein
MSLVHIAIFLIILAILALPFVAVGAVIVWAARRYRRAKLVSAPEKPD